jgi:uncharacterized protein YqgV (UPF0045/DUF77 family)
MKKSFIRAENEKILKENIIIVSENLKTKFHSDWDRLMEVVEKIERLGYRIEIVKHICRIYLSDKETIIISENIPKIEAVYNACIEFIKWYNENR